MACASRPTSKLPRYSVCLRREICTRSLGSSTGAALIRRQSVARDRLFRPTSGTSEVTGLLETSPLSPMRAVDAYEATGELRYFTTAQAIGDAMIAKFFDPVGGGFFDSETPGRGARRSGHPPQNRFRIRPRPRVTRRLRFLLCRLHALTHNTGYRDKAEGRGAFGSGRRPLWNFRWHVWVGGRPSCLSRDPRLSSGGRGSASRTSAIKRLHGVTPSIGRLCD